MTLLKTRLKRSYDNVEFYASDTWISTSRTYQKANQDLYVNEIKVRDALMDEPIRPRTVKDSIPDSRLAQYANYEYNESRELCYASGATNVSFYYPCVYSRKSMREPWMMPEVEQLFVWFTYAPVFSIIELLQTEELDHLDEEEREKVGQNSSTHWHDFHEVSPVFYEIFEKAPGKPRYKSSAPPSEFDIAKYPPTKFKIQCFEDTILRLKIISDNVRSLWSDQLEIESEMFQDEPNFLTSPLGNYFFTESNCGESNPELINCKLVKSNLASDRFQTKNTDFGELINLLDSLKVLETSISNSTEQLDASAIPSDCLNSCEEAEKVSKVEPPATRRLYSAVLQGLAGDKKQASLTGSTELSNVVTKEEFLYSTSLKLKGSLSCHETENASKTILSSSSRQPIVQKNVSEYTSQWMLRSHNWNTLTSNSSAKPHSEGIEETITPLCVQTNCSSMIQQQYEKNESYSVPSTKFASNSIVPVCYSEISTISTDNSGFPALPSHPTNVKKISADNSHTNGVYNNNNSSSSSNSNYYFNNNSFFQFNSQYRTNFPATTSSPSSLYVHNTYQTNQVSSISSRNVFHQYNRQVYPSTQSPHSVWFVHQNRPSSALYSVAHFATQPYLFVPPPPPTHVHYPPLPRQNQRWNPQTHYLRPSSAIQSFHLPSPSVPHHWGVQNPSLYRTSSNQQVYTPPQRPTDSPSSGSENACSSSTQKRTQVDFAPKPRTGSPEGSDRSTKSANGTEASSSASYSRSFDVLISLNALDGPSLAKAAASTSSLEYRKTRVGPDYKIVETSRIEKRCSAVAVRSPKENGADPRSSRSAVPIATTLSEDLERQALEQYQSSNDNFYRELERQAEEQYDGDHSENWKGPPSRRFGGHVIRSILALSRNYLYLFLVMYVDMHVCNCCLFLFS